MQIEETDCVACSLLEKYEERELAYDVLQCLGVWPFEYSLSKSISYEGFYAPWTTGWCFLLVPTQSIRKNWAGVCHLLLRHVTFPKVVIQLHFPAIFYLIHRGLTLCITLLRQVLAGGRWSSGAWCSCGLVSFFFHPHVLLLHFLPFEVVELNQSLIPKSGMLWVLFGMFHVIRLCCDQGADLK